MANFWFKFYGGEYLSDPKIERLTPLERSCWVTLLCLASMSEDGVIEFLTVESLLNKSGVRFDPNTSEEWKSALNVLDKFKEMKMIEILEKGAIKVINWEKRQEHNLTVAERVAKHRAKKKMSNTNVTNDVTSVTTEKKRKEKKRKEYKQVEDESSRTKVLFSERDLELAKMLFEKIKTNTPTFKEPSLEKWADQIRLMVQMDGRTYEQIKFVVDWSQKNSFWSANILSTKKLREKFDTLVAQIKRDAEKNKIKKSNVLL